MRALIIYFLPLTLTGIFFSFSCSDNSDNSKTVCSPGETQLCNCSGAAEGAQECREDGSGWQSCKCDEDDDILDDPNNDVLGDAEVDNEIDVPGEWVVIFAGTFTMGSPESEIGRSENETRHEVTLTRNFEIQTTEVTQSQFEEVMEENPSEADGCGANCPAEKVSWNQAAVYCNALSDMAGLERCYACHEDGVLVACELFNTLESPYHCLGYRLPTQAEWEYAARADTSTATYNGDIEVLESEECLQSTVLDNIAWYCYNSGDTPHPVAQLEANSWELYDMIGNVHEWCQDWSSSLVTTDVTDPWGIWDGSHKFYRGGSYISWSRESRASKMTWNDPHTARPFLGFRPVRSL